MKLYREVLIESAEQAEALPDGTVAIREDHYAREKVGPVSWIAPWGTVRRRDAMVGWTALVPIEAEEEWALIYEGQEPTPCIDEVDAREWARIDGEGQAPSRRYTTTWEEA